MAGFVAELGLGGAVLLLDLTLLRVEDWDWRDPVIVWPFSPSLSRSRSRVRSRCPPVNDRDLRFDDFDGFSEPS
jgi:hypothetical protein